MKIYLSLPDYMIISLSQILKSGKLHLTISAIVFYAALGILLEGFCRSVIPIAIAIDLVLYLILSSLSDSEKHTNKRTTKDTLTFSCFCQLVGNDEPNYAKLLDTSLIESPEIDCSQGTISHDPKCDEY